MRLETKRPSPDSPAESKTPTAKKGSKVILHERSARLYGQSEAKRGGSGPADKLTPDPHTTHKPKREVQVCE